MCARLVRGTLLLAISRAQEEGLEFFRLREEGSMLLKMPTVGVREELYEQDISVESFNFWI